MAKFRCPNCKWEQVDTAYTKIKECWCGKCGVYMMPLKAPTKRMLKFEKEMNVKEQIHL